MDKYQEWLEMSEELHTLKRRELALRNELIVTDKLEGSTTTHPTGYKVTVTARLTRTIDRPVLEAIWDELTDTEKECIDYKPSLVLANYRSIEESGGKLMEAVTVKPAQASLKVLVEEVI